jgi:hypothetical protein
MSDLIEQTKAALEGATPGPWMPGEPPSPWREEWFIAKTIYGDKVVLRSLPEEWSYDYTTADHTYMIAANIVCWMQFPDSEYITPPEADLARALIDATAERDALRALLTEAREDLAFHIDEYWPEATRSQYPDIMRLWKSDMDLCWRIDAALQEDTPND